LKCTIHLNHKSDQREKQARNTITKTKLAHYKKKNTIQLPLNITGTEGKRGIRFHLHRQHMVATAKKKHSFQHVNRLAFRKWKDKPPHILEIGI
jgi:hypothetical protein